MRLEHRRGSLDSRHEVLIELGRSNGLGRSWSRRRRGCRRRRDGCGQRLECCSQVGEHPLVEAALAVQIGLDPGEKAPGLRPLDYPVVIRRGHRHDLLHAQRGAYPLQSDRVGDRPGGHDRPLTRHEPRDGGHGADSPGVGERDVSPAQIVCGQAIGACLLHKGVVRIKELAERQAPRVADHGDHQRPAPVLALDIHSQSEVARAVIDAVGLAVQLGEVVGHHRHVFGGHEGDRVRDQVGE